MSEQEHRGFLVGGGELGERTRAFDWSKTPVGSVADWPQSLKIAVRIMLDSRYAMWLEIIKSYRPALVFLDLGMPIMDGYEVARRLRGQPGLENVRLAALTGWGQQEDCRRTTEAGFDHHFVKPVETKTIEALLAELKDRRSEERLA